MEAWLANPQLLARMRMQKNAVVIDIDLSVSKNPSCVATNDPDDARFMSES